jgi:hypothetical protein
MIYIYVLLLRIVAYLEGPLKILAFSIVFLLISYSTIKRIPTKSLTKITIYNFYALLICGFILVHGFVFGKVLVRDIAVLSTYWVWLIFTFNYFRGKTVNECLKFVLITFLIFNLGNYIHFKMYFADQKHGINSILSTFGVFGYRIYFPLSSGANIYTSQLALNSLIVLHFIKISKNKLIYILVLVFYIIMLILADSRLILLFGIVFSLIYWFSLKTLLLFFKKFWWALGILFFGFLFLFYNTNFFDAFKRPGEIDGRALSRIKIWGMAKDVIFSDFYFFTGHGLNGFENSILDSSKKIFDEQQLQTSHNFIIQNVIDFGIFGVIIIFFLIFKILKMVVQLKSNVITVLLVMLLFMGITESLPSFYSFEPTMFFITILSIILTHEERKSIRFFEKDNTLS